jgi:hypothetical protein
MLTEDLGVLVRRLLHNAVAGGKVSGERAKKISEHPGGLGRALDRRQMPRPGDDREGGSWNRVGDRTGLSRGGQRVLRANHHEGRKAGEFREQVGAVRAVPHRTEGADDPGDRGGRHHRPHPLDHLG